MKPAVLINGNSVVMVKDGVQYIASVNSHGNFDNIVQAIKEERWNDLPEMFNVKQAIAKFTEGLVTIVDDVLMYDGEELHNTISSRMLRMYNEGYDIKPMARFLNNLMLNPSRTAVQELYLFLETGNMPITEDGCFLAYKKVAPDFKDIYTGKFDNSPGNILEVPRNSVDDDRNRTCSYGLHFCSVEYLPSYGSASSNKVVIVKINPADVVAIPSDYRNTKGRTCKYEVISEYKDYKSKQEYFTKSLYSDEDFVDRGDDSFDTNTDATIAALYAEQDDIYDKIDKLIAEEDALKDETWGLKDALELVSKSNVYLQNALHGDISVKTERMEKIDTEIENLNLRIQEIRNELVRLGA